jgi:hypothetical protein
MRRTGDRARTPDVADDEPSVEQRLLREERMKAIRTHVMALPERQRMAVLMHKYQGMDYREIGEVLKLSESATKSLLFRAYQTLRDKLKDFVARHAEWHQHSPSRSSCACPPVRHWGNTPVRSGRLSAHGLQVCRLNAGRANPE